MDVSLARRLCLRCVESYDSPTLKVLNSAVRITLHGNYQEVAFPGTNDPKDLLDDLLAFLVMREEFGHVHKGFADCWDPFAGPLTEAVQAGVPTFYTGHSLGGALAHLAAVHFRKRGYPVAGLATFGCPNIGGQDLYDLCIKLAIPTVNYVHGCDGVTLVPPNFKTYGSKFYLDLKGNQLQTQLPFQSHRLNCRLEDHMLNGYMVAMDRLETNTLGVAA